MFNQKFRIILLICFLAVILTGVLIGQITRSSQFDSKQLQTQLENIDSSIKEANLILDQYSKNKLSQEYAKVQIEHINKSTSQFYQQIQDLKVKDPTQIKKAGPIIFDLILNLKMAQNAIIDNQNLENIKQKLNQEDIQINNLKEDLN